NFVFNLFIQKQQPRTFKEIVYWWGERRLAYNIIVGSAGLLAIGITWLAGFPVDLIRICIIAFTYGILANIIYTGGWLAEYILRKANQFDEKIAYVGPIFFAMGLVFSILLTFFGGLLDGYLGLFAFSPGD